MNRGGLLDNDGKGLLLDFHEKNLKIFAEKQFEYLDQHLQKGIQHIPALFCQHKFLKLVTKKKLRVFLHILVQ